jgi:hypothetical protein
MLILSPVLFQIASVFYVVNVLAVIFQEGIVLRCTYGRLHHPTAKDAVLDLSSWCLLNGCLASLTRNQMMKR